MGTLVDADLFATYENALQDADREWLAAMRDVLVTYIGAIRLYQQTGEARFAELAMNAGTNADDLLSCYQVDVEG